MNILEETGVYATILKFHMDNRCEYHITWADSQLQQESVEITRKKPHPTESKL